MRDYSFLSPGRKLLPPCSASALKSIEADLGYRFPEEYQDFLLFADGGMPTDNVILFSAGKGIHPAETLRSANNDRQNLPLVFIGRFAEEEFGFLRNDCEKHRRPVHVYEHETGRTKQLASSFEAFMRAVALGKLL